MDADELRRRGFRPLRPRADALALCDLAQRFDYERIWQSQGLWLRKKYRGKGQTVPEPIHLVRRIRQSDAQSTGMLDFLHPYRETKYAEQQERIKTDRSQLVDLVLERLQEGRTVRTFHALTRALTFCPPDYLEQLLQECVLPAFFSIDPHGVVQVLALNQEFDYQLRFVNAAYAMTHYSIDEVRAGGVGIATLRAWEQGVLVDYLDVLLSVLQVSSYPHIPMFHGGPFGLSFVFVFSTPQRHELAEFPRSWLSFSRAAGEFGRQRIDEIKALADADSEAHAQASHRRFRTKSALRIDEFSDLLIWSVRQLNRLVRDTSDPANFLDKGGFVDFVFAFEHHLSLLRLLKRIQLALSTEEQPAGKFLAFEVADILDEFSRAAGVRKETETFRSLFNPSLAVPLLERAFADLPVPAGRVLKEMCGLLYGDLLETVRKSVWVPSTIGQDGVRVKLKGLTSERVEPLPEFVGNVMRALRNTHHGYFTRLSRSEGPSRYLAMTTGDVPDSVSTLPLLWCIALLADPTKLIGWERLEVSAYD